MNLVRAVATQNLGCFGQPIWRLYSDDRAARGELAFVVRRVWARHAHAHQSIDQPAVSDIGPRERICLHNEVVRLERQARLVRPKPGVSELA